ncbi:hypothetical protein Tco_1486256, partial [Tanacetum coccineum]
DGDEMLAEPEVTDKDVNLSVDEVTLAQVLVALKIAKVQKKPITRPKAKGLVIHEEQQETTLTVSSQQPSQLNVQDKGKEIMVEEPVKMNKKDQISLDEELAFKLQAEEEEEEMLAREKAQREEEANIGSWDNKLFDKAIKRVNTFVDMDTELVEGSEVRAEEDKETAELQRLIKVVPDKEEVAIDAIPLATKPPSIVDYKIHKEGKKTYYEIIRAGGSLKMYLVFSHILKRFGREDLETMWKLVKAKHGSTRPEEGYERVL